MNNINLIIDANILLHGLYPLSRRGLFFVAYNLINELAKKENIGVHFFLNKGTNGNTIKSFIKKEWPSLKCGFYEYKPLIFFNLYKKYSNIVFLSWLLKKLIDFQKKKQELYRQNYIKKNACNIFFSLYHKVPGVFFSCALKKYTIVYDFIPLCIPDFFSKSELDSIQDVISGETFNNNDYYFTISENTRNDLIKYIKKVNITHVYTSYISCSDSFKPQQLTERKRIKYNIPLEKKYAFTLFTIEKRKNIERILRTFSEFLKKNKIDNLCLVVGGAINPSSSFLTKYNNSNIVFTGFLPDDDLPALYSNAEFFIYTSLYEGFGLPPLEAMRCGCPVIVSDSSALPEVVGDAGILIDCYSDEQHVVAYEKYYFDETFRKKSIQKGIIQSQKFSWKKTVDFMLEKMKDNL